MKTSSHAMNGEFAAAPVRTLKWGNRANLDSNVRLDA
jgi:hypothetical protein